MSILNRIFCVVLSVFIQVQCWAQLQATAIRQPGSSLDMSIQNEVDHAVQLSAQWIIKQQHEEGAWGATDRNRHIATAMGVIALHAAQLSSAGPAIQRGIAWLEDNEPDADEKQLATLAWYLLALSLAVPESAERDDSMSRVLTNGIARVEGACARDVTLWNEAVMAAKLGDDKMPLSAISTTNQLEKLASSWPVVATDPETVWRLARLINRAADGRLQCNGAILDWRVDLARGLLGVFRKDPVGGGYWDSKTEEGRLFATFFGIFALREL